MDRFSLPDICSFITLRFFIFFVELCQFMRDKAAKDNRENHTDSFSDLLRIGRPILDFRDSNKDGVRWGVPGNLEELWKQSEANKMLADFSSMF